MTSTPPPEGITEPRRARTADDCRRLGWLPGTRLAGDEGYGETVIEITALGEREALAVRLTERGEPVERIETAWSLDCRDWRVVRPAPVVPDSTDVLREALTEAAYAQIAAEKCLTIMPTEHGALVPSHWRDEAEQRAKPYLDAVLAVVGQGVTAEPLKVEWGVVLDDARSTDVYESREQAEAMAHYEGGVCEVVRIETWPHTPAVVRSGEQGGDDRG